MGGDNVAEKTEWVVIETADGEITANVLKSILESEEIPVLLQATGGGSVYAFSIGKLAAVKVLVPKAFEEKARELLKEEEPPPEEKS